MLLYMYLYVYNYIYMYIYMSCLICCCACALYMFHRGRVGNVFSIPLSVLTCKVIDNKATLTLTLKCYFQSTHRKKPAWVREIFCPASCTQARHESISPSRPEEGYLRTKHK